MYEELEIKINYNFKTSSLLETALMHSSNQDIDFNNERLEFLGDRVLGLIMAEALFTIYTDEQEGALAKRHAALVQQSALLSIAETLEITKHLRLSAGEKKSGGHLKKSLLADAIEALIGAIYMDGGFGPAKKFVYAFWEPLINEQNAPPEDFKSSLQEWAQANSLPLPKYKTLRRTGPDHEPRFEVEVTVEQLGTAIGEGGNKREAEKTAAAKLLKQIGKTHAK